MRMPNNLWPVLGATDTHIIRVELDVSFVRGSLTRRKHRHSAGRSEHKVSTGDGETWSMAWH
jgi:hypothetical protein